MGKTRTGRQRRVHLGNGFRAEQEGGRFTFYLKLLVVNGRSWLPAPLTPV